MPPIQRNIGARKGLRQLPMVQTQLLVNKTKAVEGATTNELAVSSNETPAYFSVVVTFVKI